MGFKILREECPNNHDKLHNQQLLLEATRWTNITSSSERKDGFVERFKIVKSAKKSHKTPEEIVEMMSQNIKTEQKSLSQTQGNIDIDRLMELLS